jgi:hypothetical protein
MQFNKDMVAGIIAETISEVLKTLEQPHSVKGVAVLPAGDACMIDVVLLDATTHETVEFSLVFQSPQRQ